MLGLSNLVRRALAYIVNYPMESEIAKKLVRTEEIDSFAALSRLQDHSGSVGVTVTQMTYELLSSNCEMRV